MRVCIGSPSNFTRMERKGSAKKSVEGSARCKPIIANESQSVASSLVSGTSIVMGGP